MDSELRLFPPAVHKRASNCQVLAVKQWQFFFDFFNFLQKYYFFRISFPPINYSTDFVDVD